MKYRVCNLGIDKTRTAWKVLIKDYPVLYERWLDFVPFIANNKYSENNARQNHESKEVAYVHPAPGNKAYLVDIKVRKQYENKNLGSEVDPENWTGC